MSLEMTTLVKMAAELFLRCQHLSLRPNDLEMMRMMKKDMIWEVRDIWIAQW